MRRNRPGPSPVVLLTLLSTLAVSGGSGTRALAQVGPKPARTVATELRAVFTTPPAVGDRTPDAALLRIPAVAKELKLTAGQASRLARREKSRAVLLQAGEDEPPDDDTMGPADLSRPIDANSEDIARVLTPPQRARLFQLALRRDGPLALARVDVAETLSIDDDQAATLLSILDGARDDLLRLDEFRMPLRSPAKVEGGRPILGPDDEREFQARLARNRRSYNEIREAAAHEAALILRKRQMETFARLRGDPFDEAALRPVETSLTPIAPPEKSRDRRETPSEPD
jgi:hypothetical protein